jgi:hypothetical protein
MVHVAPPTQQSKQAQVLADRAEKAVAHLAERVRSRELQAKLLARAGNSTAGEAAVREAINMVGGSDYLQLRADVLGLPEERRARLREDLSGSKDG